MARIPPLVMAQEIAVLLGVNRQRVHQLAALPDFPKPFQTFSVGRVWVRADVVKWARSKGRTIH